MEKHHAIEAALPICEPLSNQPGDLLQTLDAATLDSLPFRLHPRLMSIWGEATDKNQLAQLIDADGGIRDALLCAEIQGEENAKPILYDGLTRLTIYFERKAAGKVEPLPRIEVKTFPNVGDVLLNAIAVQSSRRNVSAAQIAYAGLEAKRMQGFRIESKPQGRRPKTPEDKASQSALQELPSAKEIARELGVNDHAVRVVLKSYNYPDVQQKLLSGEIAPKSAEHRMKGYKRDKDIHHRKKTLQERQTYLGTLGNAAIPDVITANGLYTVDACDGMSRITADTIALICTSLPYACDVAYDVTPGFDGDLHKYLDTFVRKPFAQYKRILESGGRVALNFDDTYRAIEKSKAGNERYLVPNIYNMVKEISKIAEDEFGLMPIGRRVWYKQNCPNYFSHGSRDCRTPVDNPNTEHIYIWAKDSATFPCSEDDSDITDAEFDLFAPTCWYIKPQRRQPTHLEIDGKLVVNPAYHPVPYPQELVYRLIKLYCPKNGVVLDPFSGSGTTCFVAKALGRPYIGIDNSTAYNLAAQDRLATLEGLGSEAMAAKIERFVPAEGERADGFKKHNVVKATGSTRKSSSTDSFAQAA